jgi:glutamyl-Q tRNA(Asp) synthetase
MILISEIMPHSAYRGRFAPSPTGPLHFGSLVAAVGSYLEARTRAGTWLVRIEDADRPRVVRGAADAILRTLDAYGFEWDGEILYQSRRDDTYAAALGRLEYRHALYPCACTRREIADSVLSMQGEPVYPGTCRSGLALGRSVRATRVRVEDMAIAFDDAVQGWFEQKLASEVGDFVVRRADGLFAYQLAVVVDDAEQGITDVARGADLLASTPRQILLQRLLGLPTPRYLHLPVVLNRTGEKLSKQTLARPIESAEAPAQLWNALHFLGQNPPTNLAAGSVDELWRWAQASWSADAIPRLRGIPAANSM